MTSMSLHEWAKDLWPFNRSLSGPGVVKTLEYLKNLNPELTLHTIPTGETVFDWEIPQEWVVRDAFLEHLESGQRFAEFSTNNLHLVGYSEPVDLVLDLSELKPRIHTDAEHKDWVPYVTSYYERTWGFCLSDNEKASLPEGRYRVLVDTELFAGEMTYADALLEGEGTDEVFFSTYICHPSMANNEISGPVLASALMLYLKENYPKSKYSYRFAYVPETIGALTYLSKNFDNLKARVVAGFVLSCVGDERSYSHVESRQGNSLADDALSAALIGKPNVKKYSFLQRGSDERQYCAPGIDLPVAGFCRTKYGEYPEYHTSADNFELVTESGLEGAFLVMRTIIDAFESGLYPKTQTFGEPQLGKRGLYPTTSKRGVYEDVRTRMDVVAYSDGDRSVFEIARTLDVPLATVLGELEVLRTAGLIS